MALTCSARLFPGNVPTPAWTPSQAFVENTAEPLPVCLRGAWRHAALNAKRCERLSLQQLRPGCSALAHTWQLPFTGLPLSSYSLASHLIPGCLTASWGEEHSVQVSLDTFSCLLKANCNEQHFGNSGTSARGSRLSKQRLAKLGQRRLDKLIRHTGRRNPRQMRNHGGLSWQIGLG